MTHSETWQSYLEIPTSKFLKNLLLTEGKVLLRLDWFALKLNSNFGSGNMKWIWSGWSIGISVGYIQKFHRYKIFFSVFCAGIWLCCRRPHNHWWDNLRQVVEEEQSEVGAFPRHRHSPAPAGLVCHPGSCHHLDD